MYPTEPLSLTEIQPWSPEHYHVGDKTAALRHDGSAGQEATCYQVTLSDDLKHDYKFKVSPATFRRRAIGAQDALDFINDYLFRGGFRTSIDTTTPEADRLGLKDVGCTVRQGDLVPTQGGGFGRFVGITPSKVVWIAYDLDSYHNMRDAFEARRKAHGG